VKSRHPSKRPSGETRTPVHIDADVYDAIRKLAKADDRPISRYVNRVLQSHLDSHGK
jgi:hypothetical protein